MTDDKLRQAREIVEENIVMGDVDDDTAVIMTGPLILAIADLAGALTSSSDRIAAVEGENAELKAIVANRDAVHLNMLRGTIAKPSIDQIAHIYPAIEGWRDALRRLVQPAPGVKKLPPWVYGIVNASLRAAMLADDEALRAASSAPAPDQDMEGR